MTHFLSGVILMGYLVAGLFFLRFWKDTRDRLFLMFGTAFLILAVQRIGFLVTADASEHALVWYLLRLLAFVLILLAIIDKNRSRTKS